MLGLEGLVAGGRVVALGLVVVVLVVVVLRVEVSFLVVVNVLMSHKLLAPLQGMGQDGLFCCSMIPT